ncbi:MAG: C25 family cysteine peptidase, partial [Anaerolineales bacterium]
GGRPLPSAIKDYLENAYFNWNLRPLYVLLVGDGTHDPKNYRATSSTTFIPPFLEDVDPWAGETAADNRYVTVDGGDALPDMLIGRLPANLWPELENPFIELDTMVSKIVQYEGQQSPSPWQHQAVFVADNNDPTSGDFPSLSDILINKFPTYPFAPQRLYFSPDQITPAGFRTLVKQVWDDGNGLIMFTGHSSIHQWAHETLFHIKDVPTLVNGPRLPVVLEMTCFTGSFQIPDFPTLDEALLRRAGGGAVAVWGSTGLGIATGHHWLAEGFMDTIYQDGISEIGAAILAGKLNLASVGSNPDLIDTFTLLGDPATKLERSYLIYLPINQN